MQENIVRTDRIGGTVQDLHPFAKRILESDIARALKFSLFACVPLVLVLWLLGLSWGTILQGCALLIALTFGLLALPELLIILSKNVRGLAAIAEAQAELALKRDLNRSGAIGDIKQIDQPKTEVKETIRFVPTNKPAPVLQVPSGGELDKGDFIEFVNGLAGRGIERTKWVSESKKGVSYKFASGHVCDRPFYDGACEILEKKARVLHNRKQGSAGTLTAAPVEILTILGLG